MPITKRNDLSQRQWEQLRLFVGRNKEELSQMTLEEAAKYCGQSVVCNQSLLEGLAEDFHVWKDAKVRK